MAAPKGNKFWELRSKHGRDKVFETPNAMWEAACEYFTWCEENPLMETDYIGNGAIKIERPKMRSFTLQGLCLFLDVNTVYFNHFETEQKTKTGEEAEGFCKIITRIRETIFNQKFTGAAAGFLHPNIIARDLGLSDKQEHTINKPVIIDWNGEDTTNPKAAGSV